LVKEREFIRLNEPIYKLGKTKQKNNKRFNLLEAGDGRFL
jgi:hypothetical protein